MGYDIVITNSYIPISVIARNINDALDTTNKINRLSAKLNKLLIESGDLCDTVIGKVETDKGRENGINGEYRTKDDTSFWVSLYNEAAQAYMVNLALEKMPELNAIALQYDFSKNKYYELANNYHCAVILLESPTEYWTYNESAVVAAEVLDYPTYTNHNNKIGLHFPKGLLPDVLSLLEKESISGIISSKILIKTHYCTPNKYNEVINNTEQTQSETPATTIDVESTVLLLDLGTNREFKMKIVSVTGRLSHIVIRDGRQIVVQSMFVPEIDCDKEISCESLIGQQLIGKSIGDTVEIIEDGNSVKYRIKEIHV